MARFHFSLQKVLDLRKHQEDQKAIELKKVQVELFQARAILRSIEDQKAQALKRPAGTTVDITMQRVQKDYIKQLSNRALRQNAETEMLAREAETWRKKLAKAVQERKAVELLREKRLLEFKKEINRKAAIQENEVALRMATRTN